MSENLRKELETNYIELLMKGNLCQNKFRAIQGSIAVKYSEKIVLSLLNLKIFEVEYDGNVIGHYSLDCEDNLKFSKSLANYLFDIDLKDCIDINVPFKGGENEKIKLYSFDGELNLDLDKFCLANIIIANRKHGRPRKYWVDEIGNRYKINLSENAKRSPVKSLLQKELFDE